MKKAISLIVITLFSVLFLTGCSGKIKSGEVYNKEFKESYTEVRMIPLIRSNGKTTNTTLVPYLYRYPDRYIISIKKFKDNEWETAQYYVAKEIYDSINIGDQFEYVEGRDLIEEPYTREENTSIPVKFMLK